MEKNFCLALSWRPKKEAQVGSSADRTGGGQGPLTLSSSNWSPPKAETQGLIPPVPKAMRMSPTMDRALQRHPQIRPVNGKVEFHTQTCSCSVRSAFRHKKSSGQRDEPGHSHVGVFVSHRGYGTHRFNHVANHVDDGQVEDGPVGRKPPRLSDAAPEY